MNVDPLIKKAKINTPFGPRIFGLQLPENIFQILLQLADDVWKRKNNIDWSSHLIGHIKHQYYVSHSELKEYGLYDFFIQCFFWYVTSPPGKKRVHPGADNFFKGEEIEIELEAFWINYQEEGEYNPIHNHGQATMSGAIHLIEPEYDYSEKRKHGSDGKLEIYPFAYYSPIMQELDRLGEQISPTPKGMYIWPGPLLHAVNPFTGKGQRVSMAYNAVHYYKDRDKKGNKEDPEKYFTYE